MDARELYEFVMQDLQEKMDVKKIHSLHKAILEESCENAINNPQKVTDKNILKHSVHTSFLTALPMLLGTLKEFLKNNDSVTLNYRNESYTITEDSPIFKSDIK